MAYTTIKKPSDYFNTKLWTGNGTDDRSITGVGFKPDWVWYKERSNVGDHTVHDVVRGAGERLFPNDTSAENLDANSLQAFETDGFQIGTNTDVNGNGETYVAWNWLANNTTASNTDGSISSTVSVNTTSGFSIVSYTGTGANATVGHGLGSVPAVIIIKRLNVVASWRIFHQAIGNTKNLVLNTTAGEETFSAMWNNTSPTSTTFSLGSYDEVNGSSAPHIAYCFAEKQGYSKFGSYVGNGSTDGTFVYTGFKPAWVMVKRSDAVDTWTIYDNKRSASGGFNQIDYALDAHSSAVEDASTSYNSIDILSNGFKCRQSNAGLNASGGSYIYMAFAEEPLVGDNPATAR